MPARPGLKTGRAGSMGRGAAAGHAGERPVPAVGYRPSVTAGAGVLIVARVATATGVAPVNWRKSALR